MNLIQNKNWGWERPGLPLYAKIISILAVTFVVGFAFRNSGAPDLSRDRTYQSDRGAAGLRRLENHCTKNDAGVYDCTDEATKEKAQKIAHWYAHYQTITARVTQYTAYESCSNKGCINASGYRPIVGRSVACPRRYPLGTQVIIQNQRLVCDDRTAGWVEKKYGPTFDIFSADYSNALRFGRKTLEVGIYEN